MTSSTTGRFSGKRPVRCLGGLLERSFSEAATGTAGAATLSGHVSNSSWLRSSCSLLEPKTRLTNKSTLCRSSAFSWRSSSFRRVSSFSRGVTVADSDGSKRRNVQFILQQFLGGPLIPRPQFASAQIHPVRQHGQGLWRQTQLGRLRLQVLGPGKSSLLQPLGQHPQTGAIPAQNLDPGMTPVAKDKQRSLTGVFTQPLRHQPVQAVEALAQVARLHGDKHFQAAGKTQHDWASERNKSAAKAAC